MGREVLGESGGWKPLVDGREPVEISGGVPATVAGNAEEALKLRGSVVIRLSAATIRARVVNPPATFGMYSMGCSDVNMKQAERPDNS